MTINYPKVQLLIDGQWRDAPGQPIISPADETEIGAVPSATPRDLDDALLAAQGGFQVWKRTSPARRAEVIQHATELLRERIDVIAPVIAMEQGKTLAQARAEVLRSCDLLAWDANEGKRLYGRVIPAEPGMLHTVIRQPLGVIAAFTPWNFPMSSPARKVGGALASGCSIILKPAEETPAGAVMLATALMDAGLPPGVLNLVYGDPAQISEHLISSPVVRGITFTGSTPVGKHVAGLAARFMKPAIMELGGHAPVVVSDDIDVDTVALACVKGKLNNAGQVCVAPTRYFVHRSVYDEFVSAFERHGKTIRVGHPLESGSDIGPLTSHRRLKAIESLVQNAVEEGARLICGGERLPGVGYMFPFTILADVPDSARIMHEEPFGPVCLVTPFDSLDEAISKANALPYGLAGYAFTRSAATAYRLAHEMEVGNLAINHFVSAVSETPFGGVKESGYGREGGVEGLECYTTVKSISHLIV